MKTFSILLIFFVVAVSCNNGNEAAILQRQNDSLKNAAQIQVQQRQIDSLKAAVNNVAQATNNVAQATQAIQTQNEEQQKAQLEAIRKRNLAFWKSQLLYINTRLDADRANLTNAEQFHAGRMPSTKEKEINTASAQLETDKLRAQQINDSVNKYQQ